MFGNNQDEAYIKMMFGVNAKKTRGIIVLQDNGEANYLAGFIPNIKSDGKTHELVECEIIIRPIRRVTTDEARGMGVTGALQQLATKYMENGFGEYEVQDFTK